MSRRPGRVFVSAWGPVVLWSTGILVVTTVPIPTGVEPGGLPLDKLVHAAMYSGLGWTVARALHMTGRSTGGALVVAIVAAGAFAGLDEWHQSWVGRNPQIADWIADAAGLLLGLGLFMWRRGRRDADREGGRKTEGWKREG